MRVEILVFHITPLSTFYTIKHDIMPIKTGEYVGRYEFRASGTKVKCKVTKSSSRKRCTIVRKSSKTGNYYYLDKTKDAKLKKLVQADYIRSCQKNEKRSKKKKKKKSSKKKKKKKSSKKKKKKKKKSSKKKEKS